MFSVFNKLSFICGEVEENSGYLFVTYACIKIEGISFGMKLPSSVGSYPLHPLMSVSIGIVSYGHVQYELYGFQDKVMRVYTTRLAVILCKWT